MNELYALFSFLGIVTFTIILALICFEYPEPPRWSKERQARWQRELKLEAERRAKREAEYMNHQ